MLPLTSRLFVFLLLASDYWGDPGYHVSPLARPLCSTPGLCAGSTLRGAVQLATFRAKAEPTDAFAPELVASAGDIGSSTVRKSPARGASFLGALAQVVLLVYFLENLHL